MKCKRCKKKIPEASVYCMYCGVKLVKSANEVSVPEPEQMKSGKWSARIMVDGKRIRVSAPTKKEYYELARKYKSGEIKIVLPEDTEDVLTLDSAITKYIESKTAVLSPLTIRSYKMIQKLRFPELMQMNIKEITQFKAQVAINEASKQLAPKTVKSSWLFVSTVIYEETGERLKVTLPQIVSNEKEWLRPEEIGIFCEAIKGDAIEIPALLALSSLRRSELLALTWDNIDLQKGIIKVRGAVVYDENNKLVEKNTNKNISSRRDVPICINQLYAALEAVEDKSGHVVTYSPNAISRKINAVCASNGLANVGVHGLRHSFASHAAHVNIPRKTAMKWGGWADNSTMEKIYTHVSEADEMEAKNAMSEFYNSRCIVNFDAAKRK